MPEQISAGELIVDVLADVSDLKTGLDKVQSILKEGNKKVGTFEKIWTGALRRVGEKATDFAFKAIKAPFSIAFKSVVMLGKGMARLAKTSVLDAAKFQTRLSEVASLGVQNMAALRDGILEVSAAIGQDLPTATEAAYQAISAGIPEGNVIDFLKVGSKAAIAGVTDMETAVDALSTAVNAYGASADEALKFSDQFFQIIKLGKTTFPELAQAIGTVLPTAAALGVSFDEVGGALALMTQKGINTNEAVTALNQLLLQLLTPAEQVAGEVDKIVKAAGGFEDLDLSSVIQQFSALSTKMQVELVGSARAVKAVLALGGEGGEQKKTIIDKIAADAVKASVELKNLKRKEEDLATTRGLDRFSQGLTTLEASATELGIPMEAVAAALGTMVERGTATSTAVGALQKIFSQLSSPAESVEKSINAIVKDAGGLENIDLAKVVEKFGDLDKKVREDILGGIREVDAAMQLTDKKGANAFEDKLIDIERAAKKAARSAKSELSDLDRVISEIGGAGGATETAFAQFAEDFELEAGKIKQSFVNFATEVATPVAEAIGEVFAQINEKITPNLAPIAKVIKEWFVDLWEGGFDQQAVDQMAAGMGISIEEAIEALGGKAGLKPSLKSTLSSLVDRIGESISEGVQALERGDTSLVDMFAAWAKAAREKVGEEIRILFDTEFAQVLKDSWEKNKEKIEKTAKDLGAVIGAAIGKGLLATIPTVLEEVALAYGGVVFDISEGIKRFATRNLPENRPPASSNAPPPAPSAVNSPSPSAVTQSLVTNAARQPAAAAGPAPQQPLIGSVTWVQRDNEDPQTMMNRFREMLLDIQREGNSRGLVAAEAPG